MQNEILNVIKNSKNKHQVLKTLGWDVKTQGYRKLNKFISDNDVNLSHFETIKERYNRLNKNNTFPPKISIEKILVQDSTYSNSTSLKKRLYNERLKNPICEKCGQDEMWNGEKMSLILDHINGIHNDNRLENLRIVCPNCNSTLPTHCGRNSSLKKKKKRKKEMYEINMNKSLIQRKNKRPPYDQLISEINELGYVGTSRKYDVSDNSIRKWKKYYEKYQ